MVRGNTHKDNLAKLLAEENLTITHKQVPTAMFDVKNRELVIPIFKDSLSDDLLDLFIGHEVGHARNTPAEGLHSAVHKNPTMKGYLNVIEDVRIEKLIKKKYPGLKKSFIRAYKELMALDFFGIANMDQDELNDLSLIDRINLTTKVGWGLGIKFTDEEKALLQRSLDTETWEEVVALSEEIYAYSEANEDKEDDEQFDDNPFDGASDEEQEESEENNTSGDNDEGTDDESETESNSGDEQQDSNEDPEGGSESSEKLETPEQEESDARRAMTEENAHDNEGKFYDVFASEPIELNSSHIDGNADPKEVMVDWKTVSSIVDDFYANESTTDTFKSGVEFTRKRLERKNKKIVAMMVKEFEMKKNASLHAKAKSAKTGAIDTLKLAKYQIVEDMFKRATVVPEGKNHGVIVYIDWSVDDNAESILEQAFILAEFCRKVNIAHRIFLFTKHGSNWHDVDVDEKELSKIRGTEDATLTELFNNNMKVRDYRKALDVVAMMVFKENAKGIYWDTRNARSKLVGWAPYDDASQAERDYCSPDYTGDRSRMSVYGLASSLNIYNFPTCLRMGGTPLNLLMLTARKLLREQRLQYRTDYQNLIVITDGYSERIYSEGVTASGRWGTDKTFYTDPYSNRKYDIAITGDQFKSYNLLCEYVKNETGASITGYFLVKTKREFESYFYGFGHNVKSIRKENDEDKVWKGVLKSGGGHLKGTHMDKFLFIKEIKAKGDDQLSDELVGAQKGKIKTAFARNAGAKLKSRFVVNQLIEGLQL